MNVPSVKKNVILNMIYQVLNVAVPFITAPYLARVLGPEGMGRYSFTNSIQAYFCFFCALGTATYGVREISRERDNVKQRSLLFWEIELLTCMTSISCIIIWLIMTSCSSGNRIYYFAWTMNLFSVLFDISWFYVGLELFGYTVGRNAVVRVLGMILIFVFVKAREDLILYVCILAGMNLVGSLSLWAALRKYTVPIKLSELNIFRHFRETLIYFIPTIATSIYTMLDKTLIGIITHSLAENGYYEQATRIIDILKSVTFTALNAVMGARISYLFAQNSYDEIHRKIEISINYVAFVGVGVMFGIIGVADRFVPVFFGDGYTRVALLMKMLSPMAVIIGISNCLENQFYFPAGLRNVSAKFVIVGSVLNLFLNLLLIPRYMSVGAVAASIISEIVITGFYIRRCCDFISPRIIASIFWKKVMAGIAMFSVLYLINGVLSDGVIALALEVVIGAIVYCTLIMIMKDQYCLAFVRESLSQSKRYRDDLRG